VTAPPLADPNVPDWGAYCQVDSAEALEGIRRPGIRLCWWRRALEPSVTAFMAAQRPLMPRQRMFSLSDAEPLESVLDAQLSGFVDSRWHGYGAWREDVLRVIAIARALSRGPCLRIRLESVASNGCRLFHSDLVPLRLITTYRGPGTEWLPDWAVDPRATSRQDNQHVLDMTRMSRLGAGDIALMKGDRYPGEQRAGLMHRSPPSAPGAPRFVLAIDLD